jgi:uncharacterized delta-60 repeat protein
MAAVAIFVFLGGKQITQATEGDLDPSFGIGGKEMIQTVAQQRDFARTVAIQPDGRIVLGGELGDFDSYANSAVLMRLNPNGSLDQSFGSGGKVISTAQRHLGGLVFQPDGKILTAGALPGTPYGIAFAVSRYNADGSLDQSFGNGGFATIGAQSATIVVSDGNGVALQPDGKIVVVGYASINPGGERFLLARFNPDGTLDQTFGTNGSVFTRFTNGTTRALTVALQPDGKIIAAGYNVADQETRNFALARYNTDGSLDLNFGLEGMVTTNFNLHNFAMAKAIVIQPDGKIIATGGLTRLSDGFLLARYGSDGRLDQTFGTGGKVTTTFGSQTHGNGGAIVLQADGKILVAGTISRSDPLNTGYDFAVARYNPNGSFDPTFGNNGFTITAFNNHSVATACLLQADGKLVVAGYAGEPGASYDDFAVARYLGAMQLMGADSRKIHGNAGTFDINLPLTGTPAVESRDGHGNYTLVFTFSNDVTGGGATITEGSAKIAGSPTYSGKTIEVNLAEVSDGQTITVMLSDVTDRLETTLPPTSVRVSFLAGDTNGDGVVNSGDALQTRSRSGQTD